MRVRFAPPARTDADREDGLRLHHAPARRAPPVNWRWFLLLAVLALPLLWLLERALVAVSCS